MLRKDMHRILVVSCNRWGIFKANVTIVSGTIKRDSIVSSMARARSFTEVRAEMGRVRTEVGVALEEVKHSSSRILEVGKMFDRCRIFFVRRNSEEDLGNCCEDMLSQMLPQEYYAIPACL